MSIQKFEWNHNSTDKKQRAKNAKNLWEKAQSLECTIKNREDSAKSSEQERIKSEIPRYNVQIWMG